MQQSWPYTTSWPKSTRVGWKRYINCNLDVNKISLYIDQFVRYTDCLYRVVFFFAFISFMEVYCARSKNQRLGQEIASYSICGMQLLVPYPKCCARSRYQKQGQVITYRSIFGMYLLFSGLDTCFWQNNPEFLNGWSWDNLDNLMFRLRVSKYLKCYSRKCLVWRQYFLWQLRTRFGFDLISWLLPVMCWYKIWRDRQILH